MLAATTTTMAALLTYLERTSNRSQQPVPNILSMVGSVVSKIMRVVEAISTLDWAEVV